MFRAAYSIASQFTRPVVISRLARGGKCSSAIGAFVVVNPEGWILTASHIVELVSKLASEVKADHAYESQVAAIHSDKSLAERDRRHQLKKLKQPSADATKRSSVWWSWEGVSLKFVAGFAPADIAIGKLEPFDPAWVTTYPTFKDPTKNFEPGTSLCKLGFPFHSITPSYDAQSNNFQLPAGAIPIPMFPIEGIFTRVAGVLPPDGVTSPLPVFMVETSSPGLKGQSGGPTFDTQGTVWAIQSKTSHLPLGFSPPVPGGKPGEKEHQFLNVGLGVHPTTFFALLDKYKVKYNVSAY